MKTKVLFSLCLLASAGIQAQVGVNNTDPKASLHITPQKTDGTTAEGIIAPNLTRAQLIGKDVRYTAAQKGAIVYVTTLDGTISAKTTKITTIGYYYFDGALWQPFSQAETVVPTEPWRVQGGAAQAISNTENIYQAGKVAIGVAQTGAALGQSLYVNGATLLQGATEVGTTAAPANAAISGTSTLTGKVGIGRAPATSDYVLAVEGNSYTKGTTYSDGNLTVAGTTASKATNMGGLLKYKPTAAAVTVGQYMRASAVDGSVEWATLPTTATTEPWRVQGGTTLATGNTENIYQAGKVAIGVAQTGAAKSEALYVSGTTAMNGNTTIGTAGSGTTAGTGNLRVHGTEAIGTVSTKYTGSNYTLQVFGEGNLGGLWVEKSADVRANVRIGEYLTAADNALAVVNGTSILNGATTIGSGAAPATLNVTGTTTTRATNMNGLLKYKPTSVAVTVGQYMRASAVDGSVEWGALPTTATTEPWRVQGGTTLATSNTEHIYQAGRVAIGVAQTTPGLTQALYVNGATLLKGSTTVGTTAAPSNLTITGTSALVGNTQVGTAAAPTNLTVTGTSALVKATTVGTTAANANLVVNGNAGIGAAPLHKLHVAGNEYVSGRAKVGGAADPATLFASAQLELADTDKGFLPNRVALTNSTIKAPVPYAVDGMMVYNTATVAAQDISPGFYYWKANRWNRLVDVIPNKSISLLNLQAARTSASVNGGGGTAGGTHLAFTNKVGIGDYIEIPEDGSYAFSFRLYGIMSGTASSTTIVYYLNLMRGTTILDVAEMDIPFVKNPAIGQVLTYSVTLGADLVAGDKVYFRLGHLSATPYPWALAAHSSNSNAARTSMVWWKL